MAESRDPYARASGILQNSLNLDAAARLREAEAALTTSRMSELYEGPVLGTFDREHLAALHRTIFQDVYPWAGHMRDERFEVAGHAYDTVEISKNGTQFLPSALLDNGFDEAFKPIRDRGELARDNDVQFAQKAGRALAELNYVHPFREGNGRTQRAFFTQLGQKTGHEVDFRVITAARMNAVAIEANDNPATARMPQMMLDATDPGRGAALRGALAALREVDADPDEYIVRTARMGERVEGQVLGHDDRTAFVVTDGPIIVADTRDLPGLETNREVSFTVERDVSRSYGADRDRDASNERDAAKDLEAER